MGRIYLHKIVEFLKIEVFPPFKLSPTRLLSVLFSIIIPAKQCNAKHFQKVG